MYIVCLKHAAEIGLVGRSALQALQGRRFIAERFEEGIGECLALKWLLSEQRDGLFDLNCIHAEMCLLFPGLLFRKDSRESQPNFWLNLVFSECDGRRSRFSLHTPRQRERGGLGKLIRLDGSDSCLQVGWSAGDRSCDHAQLLGGADTLASG